MKEKVLLYFDGTSRKYKPRPYSGMKFLANGLRISLITTISRRHEGRTYPSGALFRAYSEII
jgi:hypothetical protein